MIKKILLLPVFLVAALFVFVIPASADTVSVNFENPPYNTGSIHNQNGWTSSGSAGSGCAVYDHAVSTQSAFPAFGSQSLRISNAVTSGCFGDQTFAKPLIDSVGESGSTAGSFPAGSKQTKFEMQFSIGSATPAAQQPGLFMSVSPDRGDGSRMSYLGFADNVGGIDVNFFDVQGTSNPANFVGTTIATGLSRSATHTIKLTLDVVEGPSNDVVKVYINGSLVHTGTSWENYYRFDSEASAEQSPRIVRTAIFRTGGGAVPAHAGKGFLIDNLSLASIATPPAAPTNLTGDASPGFQRFGQSITINWQDNANNETRYEVQYTKLYGYGITTITLPANSTTFTMNGLSYRDAFNYRVRACNTAGCSAYTPFILVIVNGL